MKNKILISSLALCVFTALSGCADSSKAESSASPVPPVVYNPNAAIVEGIVSADAMLFPADVQIKGKNGKQVKTTTDVYGHFSADVSGMSAPLVLAAKEKGAQCSDESQQMGICLASVTLSEPKAGNSQTVNLNPLTDYITSQIAAHSGFAGPEQLSQAVDTQKVTQSRYQLALQSFDTAFNKAVGQLGLPKDFNPIDYASRWQGKVDRLNALIWENRGYQSSKGLPSQVMMLNKAFEPIGDKDLSGNTIAVDAVKIEQKLAQIQNAKTRVFIVGDSTASIYTHQQFPRMGWGQVFQQHFDPKNVQVVDGAQSGRSSRLYRNQGWFRYLSSMMRPGDYLFIEMGHNDEKCDAAKAGRGAVDVANLCTYPNTAEGKEQYPKGHPEMSFANSLEFYVNYARAHQMTPVLLTPTTRFKNAHGRKETPVVHGHYIKSSSKHDYAFVGDYSQTIKDTAQKNSVPLLDVEAGTIAQANKIGNANWKKYWLAVDPQKYPYYSNRTGRVDKPDTTHFQQRGAQMVASVVAGAIKQNSHLSELAQYLN